MARITDLQLFVKLEMAVALVVTLFYVLMQYLENAAAINKKKVHYSF